MEQDPAAKQGLEGDEMGVERAEGEQSEEGGVIPLPRAEDAQIIPRNG